jgi:hypothetical protein
MHAGGLDFPKLVDVERSFRQAHFACSHEHQLVVARVPRREGNQLGDREISIPNDDFFTAPGER